MIMIPLRAPKGRTQLRERKENLNEGAVDVMQLEHLSLPNNSVLILMLIRVLTYDFNVSRIIHFAGGHK